MSKVKEEKSHVVFSLQNKVGSIAMPAGLSNNSSKFDSCCGADTCSTGKVSSGWAYLIQIQRNVIW